MVEQSSETNRLSLSCSISQIPEFSCSCLPYFIKPMNSFGWKWFYESSNHTSINIYPPMHFTVWKKDDSIENLNWERLRQAGDTEEGINTKKYFEEVTVNVVSFIKDGYAQLYFIYKIFPRIIIYRENTCHPFWLF